MIEEKRFLGGMDFDSAPTFIKEGDYRKAVNCDMLDPRKGELGRVTPVDGMIEISSVLINPTKHEVIGSIESLYHNAIIYCVADTIGSEHMVLKHNENGTFEKIIEGDFLNFNVSNPVRDMNIIEDFLLINDGLNPPRCFDIELARNKTNSLSGDQYSTLNEETIKMIKAQPIKTPDHTSVRDEDLIDDGIDNLGLKSYRFKYAYVFEDGREGSYNIGVKPAITRQRIHSFTNTLPKRLWDNVIKVEFDIDTPNVKEVVIAVKKGGEAVYSEFARIDVQNPVGVYNNQDAELSSNLYDISTFKPFHVNFTNTEVLHPLKPYNDRMFDDVPYVAGTQEVSSDNRVVYGDYETGYDPVEAIMEGKSRFDSTQSNFGASGFIRAGRPPEGDGADRIYWDYYTLEDDGSNIDDSSLIAYFDSTFYSTQSEYDGYTFKVIGSWPDFSMADGKGDLKTKLDTLSNQLGTIGGHPTVHIWKISPLSAWEVPPTVNPLSDWDECTVSDSRKTGSDYLAWRIRDNSDGNRAVDVDGVSGGLYIYSTNDISTTGGLKSNSEWKLGIIYSDKYGRVNSVSKGQNATISTGVAMRDSDGAYNGDVDIYHKPPEWAVKYRIVSTKNKTMNRYWQMPVMEVFTPDQLKTRSFAINDSDVLLKIPLGTEDKDLSDNFSDLYGYSNGDRFRILDGTSTDTFEVRGLIQNAYKTGQTDEVPGKFLIVSAASGYNFNDISGKLIEIYQPVFDTDEDELYYEIAEGSIIDSGLSTRRHAGIDGSSQSSVFTDGKSSTPAVCNIHHIDSWRIMKRFPYFDTDNEVLFPSEDNTIDYAAGGYKIVEVPNLMGDMKDDSYFGRANAVLDDYGRTRKGSSVTYSESYILNTDIRNVNVFIQDVNFEEYKVEKGDIKKLKLFNDMMYIFQEDEINAVHMGKNMIYNADGTGSLSASSLIFSRPIHVSNLGLQDETIDTVTSSENILYFHDLKRKTLAGIYGTEAKPITAKMESFISNSDEILQSTKLNYGFDIARGELVMSYNGNGEGSLIYSEPNGRFTKFYQHYSSQYVNFNNEFYGFDRAKLWKHNADNGSPNQFYGNAAQSSILEFWFNTKTEKEKMPLSFKLNSDARFVMELSGENGEAQSADIPYSFWDRQGRSWFTWIPMNKMTPNMTTDEAMINGEPIRDRNLKATLTWDHESPTFSLESIELSYKLSHTAFN